MLAEQIVQAAGLNGQSSIIQNGHLQVMSRNNIKTDKPFLNIDKATL